MVLHLTGNTEQLYSTCRMKNELGGGVGRGRLETEAKQEVIA